MVTIDVDNAGTSTAAWHKDICFIAKNKLLISITELIARNFRRHSSKKKLKLTTILSIMVFHAAS